MNASTFQPMGNQSGMSALEGLDAADTEGLSLAELGSGALQMKCASFTPGSGCEAAMSDQLLAMALVAGFMLFAASASLVVVFDRTLLPPLLVRWRQQLSGEHLGAREGSAYAASTPKGGFVAGDLLRMSAAAAAEDAGPVPPDGPMSGDPAPSPLASPSAREVSVSAAAQSTVGPGCWPPRLAGVWALRSAFLYVSAAAAVARLAQVSLCAAELGRPGALVAAEAALCLLPWLWCWAGSRMPAAPDCGIPGGAARGCRLPRFTTFALLTAALELFSVAVTAQEVAGAPCGQSVWAINLSYCVGVVAVAARMYSALLALRLQDELVGATARVMPAAYLAQVDVEFDQLGDPACGLGPRQAAGPDAEAPGWEEPTKPAAMSSKACALGPCCWTWRRLVLLGVVVAAVASVWVARALGSGEAPAEKLPSSCATAQNGTSTCTPWEYAGEDRWDHSRGRSYMEMANTMEDCCTGCDEVGDCQAWIYEGPAKRCRWIRFLEDPCLSNPADLGCRCITHFGMSFGFKPTTQIIWVRGDQA